MQTILDDFECPPEPMTEYGDIARSRDNDMSQTNVNCVP